MRFEPNLSNEIAMDPCGLTCVFVLADRTRPLKLRTLLKASLFNHKTNRYFKVELAYVDGKKKKEKEGTSACALGRLLASSS